MFFPQDGGSIARQKVSAVIRDMINYAAAILPVPGMDPYQRKPEFVSKDTDSTLASLAVGIPVEMRDREGSLERVEINITRLADFEESSLIEKVEILRELDEDIQFLETFQDKVANVKAFQTEMDELIFGKGGENLDKLLVLLDNWIELLESPTSELLKLIKN